MVLLLRLAPVVPFAALNYAMGATSVGLWPYTWASALGIVPGAALHWAPHLHLAPQQKAYAPRALHSTMRWGPPHLRAPVALHLGERARDCARCCPMHAGIVVPAAKQLCGGACRRLTTVEHNACCSITLYSSTRLNADMFGGAAHIPR